MVTVTYTAADGDVATSLKGAAGTPTAPDLAVLSLPTDLTAMKELARAGTLASLDFAVPAVRSNYAFSWKSLGTVDRNLVGLPFRATNRSAIWYDARAFKSEGLKAPSSWKQMLAVTATLRAHGLAPFAIGGKSAVALPNLFQNVYLMLEGNARYDKLMNGEIPWTDSSVRDALRTTRSLTTGMAGGGVALGSDYAAAVQKVFGSPMKAVMVPGGSATLPVLYSAKAVRPLAQFGVFSFPRTNGAAPPRVIGDADVVTMVKDSEAARALVGFLATPEAATIWAKRGGFFLSPNRKVDLSSYALPAIRTLATSLTRAGVFRLGIADARSPEFKKALNAMLVSYLRNPGKATEVMTQLDKAAASAQG
jgi:ABC-type glycerol-3-phosphate transport system substrate-binding protein